MIKKIFSRRNRGFIQAIILIIIALALLKYFFNISLADILNNQVVKDIWSITKSLFQVLWQTVQVLFDFLKQLVASAKDFVSNGIQP
ncbi:MAG TPA: hypothetical protein VJH63_02740 [Candidatus Paceibacterota bacterium]